MLRNTLLGVACGSAVVAGLALAAKPGGGTVSTWTVRLQGIGDSIMQGYNATCTGNTSLLDLFCYSGGEQPENSFFDGTSSAVVSLADRFIAAGASTTYSKAASQSGSEMVGGTNNFATQAQAIVGASRKAMQVKVELGGNDICNRTSTATMYSPETWRAAVRAGLDTLTQRLPDGSSVVLVGVPRVQDLHDVGVAKSLASGGRVDCPDFWQSFDVCNIATVDVTMGGETLAQRLAFIEQRQARYNEILAEEAAWYNARAASTRVEVVAESTGRDPAVAPEVGNYRFAASEINGGDCFHPSIAGQNRVSAVVWGNDRFTRRPN
ncbi:MAG TPA: SGNH/GDSL hydrolase family protein [Steroidobacteraceae bacterium]|nr:SGNH/GDSL hydrolase family protein [Steroidobacteraceae bacterium]